MNSSTSSSEIGRLAKMPGRDAYGMALAQIGEEKKNIVVLGADTMVSCRTAEFQKKFPERTFNVGIAEANMVGMAAGLATCGKIPFVNTFGFLLSMRACEQVRTDLCYPNLNVKLVTSMFGLIAGTGGTTHHCTEDLAIMRSFANMVVMEAADGFETVKAVRAIAKHVGPVYLRVGRDKAPVYEKDYDFQMGKGVVLREGKDATIIACGILVSRALVAAAALAQRKIDVQVINMHTIKPLDRKKVRQAAGGKIIVTAEEHSIIGGLGSAVAEIVAEEGLKVPVKRIGIQDVFCGIGPTEELREKHGLTSQAMIDAILKGMGK
jgi:transketolase